MLERCGEKGTLLFCWWECKRIQSLGKVSSEPVLLTSAPLTLGWKLLGEGGGCPEHWRVFDSIPGPYPRDAIHAPQCDNQQCLQTLPDVLQVQYHWFRAKT